MKRIEIKKLNNGFFGVRGHWVESDDVEVTHQGETYLLKKGTRPHKRMPWESKFGPDANFEMYMYKLPVVAQTENQLTLF